MRRITKDEVKILREKFPYVHIRRTVNTYYAEENYKAIKYLDAVNKGCAEYEKYERVVGTDAKA